MQEHREIGGVFSKCSWETNGDTWQELDFTSPAGPPDLTYENINENFCGQQVLLCVGHKLLDLASSVAPVPYPKTKPLDVTITEIGTEDVPTALVPSWLLILAFDIYYNTFTNSFLRSHCLLDNDQVRIADCEYTFLIPPQSAANNSLLLLAAASAFREASYRGMKQIEASPPRGSSDTWYEGLRLLVSESNLFLPYPTSLLDMMITAHVDSINYYIESVEKLVQNQISVSASYASDNPDLATARDLEWNGEVNSRSGTVRILYEGEPPWIDGSSTHFPVVYVDPTIRGTRDAITLIRSMGIEVPKEGDISIDEIAMKIARAYYEDYCWLGDFSGSPWDLLARLEVSSEDLGLAARYIQQEQFVFRRPEIVIPFSSTGLEFPCGGDWPTHEARYGNIKNFPFNLPERLITAQYSTNAWDPDLVLEGRRGLAYSANRALAILAMKSLNGLDILSRSEEADSDWAVQAISYAPLLSTATQNIKTVAGDLLLNIVYDRLDPPVEYPDDWTLATQLRLHLAVYGDAPFSDEIGLSPGCRTPDGMMEDNILDEKLLVVTPADISDTSTAIIQCMTTHFVEGRPCTIEDWGTVEEILPSNACSGEHWGLWEGKRDYYVWLPFDRPAYIFRTAGSQPPELIGAWTERSLRGHAQMVYFGDWPVSRYVLDGMMEDWVAKALRRDIKDAGKVGRGQYAPPLENELISNSNEYEDSWRHYLEVAKQSAAEADALGEQIISSGLEMDMRAEAALNKLEEICGSVMNVGNFQCDPADADATCSDLQFCDGHLVSGCADRIYGGVDTEEGQVNPALSSCIPGGAKARKVDFLALGGPMCFWIDVANGNEFCGTESLANAPEQIPPCPFPRTGAGENTCEELYFSSEHGAAIHLKSGGRIVVLGDHYAPGSDSPIIDPGSWHPMDEGTHNGWRLRFLTLFEPEDEGDPPLAAGMPVCELVRVLHRKGGCFADFPNLPPARDEFGNYISDESLCGGDVGIWMGSSSSIWTAVRDAIVQDIIENQGWLSSDDFGRALDEIELDADIAHHYMLEVGNTRVFSTRVRDISYNSLDRILADPNEKLDLSNLDYSSEQDRTKIGHHLQDALVELGFIAGHVKGISLGRPGIAGLTPTEFTDTVETEYLANPRDLSLLGYCGDSPDCPSEGTFKIAKIMDVESRRGADCGGDESCKCLYLNWQPPYDVGWHLPDPFSELRDAIFSTLEEMWWYEDSENIPCITMWDGSVISVRDDCAVSIAPDNVELGSIKNLFGNKDFWKMALGSIASLPVNAVVPLHLGDLNVSDTALFARYYNTWKDDSFSYKAERDSCEVEGVIPRPDNMMVIRMADEGISHLAVSDSINPITHESRPAVMKWNGTADRDTFFWAIELACEAIDTGETAIQCADFDVNDLTRENVDHTSEIYLLTRHLECAAEAFKQAGQTLVLRDIPEAVVDTALTPAWEPQSPDFGGTVLQSVNAITDGLEELNDTLRNVEFELALTALDVEGFRGQVKEIGLNAEIAQLQSIQSMIVLAAQAINSLSNANNLSKITGGMAAGLYAAAAGIEGMIMGKQEQLYGTRVDNEFNLLQTNMIIHLRNLKDYYIHMADTLRDIENNLEIYNALLRDAERQVAIATFADSDPAGRVYNVNTVMRRHHNTMLKRYEKRLDFAKKAALRARKAIEFRTGIDISTETLEMDLVPAPSTWIDNLDKLQGIDYRSIRCVPTVAAAEGGLGGDGESDSGTADTGCMAVDDYAEQFIGDWVALLEGYMESYSAAHPFSDGEDYAVVSLRDDILSVREFCQMETENLLYYSEDLSANWPRLGPESEPEGMVGWRVEGCPVPTDPADLLPSCLSVTSFSSREYGGTIPCGYFQDELGYWDIYYCQGKYSDIKDAIDPRLTSYDGRVVQVVKDLPRGTYLLSWFDLDTMPSEPHSDYSYQLTVEVPGELNGDWEVAFSWSFDDQESWSSRRVLIRLDEMMDLQIGFDPSPPGSGPDAVALSAVSLTYVDDYYRWGQCCTEGATSGSAAACVPSDCTEILPAVFEPTGASRLLPGVCPDIDGSSLRHMFGQKCDYLCADGFQETSCSVTDPGAYAQWCYYEVPFHVSLEELERGETITSGAIALGNFNYRHVEVGVNIVGTNVIDCTMTDYSTTCYTNAFIEYSLKHGGSFEVRNHRGEDVDYYLPSAWIEHKKALNTETVLTNPATGSQRELLADYMNGELWGRPLTGDYVLRIWDKDGLVWNHIEDIQVVLRYHYWTRHTE